MKHEAIIKIENLEKVYKSENASEYTLILSDVNLEINATDFVVIYGASGSGKSTLIHHIVGLELPTKGKILVRGTDITKLNPEQRAIFRAEKFGMVYQSSYWSKSLSVWENVAMPLLIDGFSWSNAHDGAIKALKEVGMAAYANKTPLHLSGGEQQRIGIARALVNNPWIIIADEPTGNLDSKNADDVIKLFKKLNQENHRTVIMVTHNLSYLPLATKTIAIKDGKVISSGEKVVKEQIRRELKEVL